MSWLIKQFTVFGATPWPEAIVSGLFLTVIFAGLSLWALERLHRYRMRHALSDSASLASNSNIPTSDVRALGDRIRALEEQNKRVIDDYQSVSGKAEQMRAEIARLSDYAKRIDQRLESERERRLGSLYALGARERLSKLEEAIFRDAANLFERLKAGEKYDAESWNEWERLHEHWEKSLDQWISEGTWYAVAVKERTLTVDDKKYGLPWPVSDGQFSNAEANRRFKQFRIIHQQWVDVLPNVQSGLDTVAFSGLADLEARSERSAGCSV